MTSRTHHIDKLIINSPFEEPAEHWSYDRSSRLFTRDPGCKPAVHFELLIEAWFASNSASTNWRSIASTLPINAAGR